jgi:hypothetical protein
MPSTLSLSTSRNFKEIARDSLQMALIFALVFGFAGAMVVVAAGSNRRDLAVIGGLCAGLLGAFVSGRPRLYCLWGLMLTLPLNLSKRVGPMFLGKPGGEDSFRIEVSDLFLFALACFILYDIVTQRRKGLRIPKVTFLWLMLIGIGIAWIIIGPWRISAAQEVVRMLKVMLLFLVVANELDRPTRLWHSAVALGIGAIVESGIALAQYEMKGLIGLEVLGETTANTIDVLGATSVQGDKVFRPSALLQHPNLLGMFLAVVIPLAIGMLMVSKRSMSRTFFVTTIGVSFPAVVVCLSRSAWVSAAISTSLVLFFSLFHPTLRWRSLVVSTLAGILGLAIIIPFIGPITSRLLNSKDDATIAREIYKQDARRMIASAPYFGRGLNSYSFEMRSFSTMALQSYGPAMVSVHNIFYLWWAETGIVGMVLFCGVWLSMIWAGITNLVARDEVLFIVNAACLAGMIALIPDGFLSFTLRVNTLLRMFWVIGGIIMAVRYMRLRENSNGLSIASASHQAPADTEAELTPVV